MVWTSAGQAPIESIQVGDSVLAQDVETGELAFKPVLSTSVRPPSPLMIIDLGVEQFVATRGHPLWVVGKGWRMAKELQPGDLLHTADGGVAVESIDPGVSAEAYNLVVAEFNDYFVGKSKVLAHDNTIRQDTDSLLPGYTGQTASGH
jgi:hypothetical protein